MAAFFTEVWETLATPSFMEKVRRKFHYGQEWGGRLSQVAQEMLPLLERDALWERLAHVPGEPAWERVAMTLGAGVDGLQEEYARRGQLSECYMAEVIASEILLEGYGAYTRYIRSHTSWHVARLRFPGGGEELPLEAVPGLLAGFTLPVRSNAACCLTPLKSVVFLAELTQDGEARCEGVCAGCGNADCPNRMADAFRLDGRLTDIPLHYGYRKIFEGNAKIYLPNRDGYGII